VSAWAFQQNLKCPSLKWAAVLCISVFLLPFTHLFSLTLIASLGLTAILCIGLSIFRNGWAPSRSGALASAVVILAGSLAFLFTPIPYSRTAKGELLSKLLHSGYEEGGASAFIATTSEEFSFIKILEYLSGASGVLLWLCIGLGFLGLGIMFVKRPCAALLCASAFGVQSVLFVRGEVLRPRYTLFLLPFVLMCIAVGSCYFAELSQKPLKRFWKGGNRMIEHLPVALMVGFLSFAALPKTISYVTAPTPVGVERQDLSFDAKATVRFLESQVGSDDIVFCFPVNPWRELNWDDAFLRNCFRFYAGRLFRKIEENGRIDGEMAIWYVTPFPDRLESEILPSSVSTGWGEPVAVFTNSYVFRQQISSESVEDILVPNFSVGGQHVDGWHSSARPTDFRESIVAAEDNGPVVRIDVLQNTTPYLCYSPRFAAAPQQIVELTALVRGHGSLLLRFLDEDGDQIREDRGPFRTATVSPALSGWRTVRMATVTPPWTASMQIGFGVDNMSVAPGDDVLFRNFRLRTFFGPELQMFRDLHLPGFEKASNRDTFKHWDTYAYSGAVKIIAEHAGGDRRLPGMKLKVLEAGTNWQAYSRPVAVFSGKTIEFSGYVTGTRSGAVRLEYSDGQGNKTGHTFFSFGKAIESPRGSGRYKIRFRATVPRQAIRVRLGIRLLEKVEPNTEIQFDSLRLKSDRVVLGNEGNILRNPGFEQWDADGKLPLEPPR